MAVFFGKNIKPACRYCRHGKIAADKKHILCEKKGVVYPSYYCKKYWYDPIKRPPRRSPSLPSYRAEDFLLKEKGE